MTSSSSSIFLVATIMLASLCHIEADLASRQAGSVAQAQATAQKAISTLQGATNVAKKYIQGSTQAPAKTCIVNFGDATELLNESLVALKTFKKQKVNDLQTWGSAAMTSVDTCSDEFESGQPTDLKQVCTKVHEMIVSYLKIVNSL